MSARACMPMIPTSSGNKSTTSPSHGLSCVWLCTSSTACLSMPFARLLNDSPQNGSHPQAHSLQALTANVCHAISVSMSLQALTTNVFNAISVSMSLQAHSQQTLTKPATKAHFVHVVHLRGQVQTQCIHLNLNLLGPTLPHSLQRVPKAKLLLTEGGRSTHPIYI